MGRPDGRSSGSDPAPMWGSHGRDERDGGFWPQRPLSGSSRVGSGVLPPLALRKASSGGVTSVYSVRDWCMRTNVDIDDEVLSVVMRRYRLATKTEAVDLRLRDLIAETDDV